MLNASVLFFIEEKDILRSLFEVVEEVSLLVFEKISRNLICFTGLLRNCSCGLMGATKHAIS